MWGGDGGELSSVSSDKREYDEIELVSDTSSTRFNPSFRGNLMGLLGTSKRRGRPFVTKFRSSLRPCIDGVNQNSSNSFSKDLCRTTEESSELSCCMGECSDWVLRGEVPLVELLIRSDTNKLMLVAIGNKQDLGESSSMSGADLVT